jgi:ribosome-associated translation inhibitor RaiA
MQERLRIVPEFKPEEYDRIRALMFGRLERRLARWRPEEVELELSVKDRDTAKQRMVLECWIHREDKLVATSREPDLMKAVVEVRDDLRRQIDRLVTKRETARRR